jgi:transketolase
MNTVNLAKNLRKLSIQMTNMGKSSHIGSILSICDILSVLYGKILRINKNNPLYHNRDRFILSKGHAGAGVYAALAVLGFFSKKKLFTHCQNNSSLSGHVSHIGNPGVEFSTGSLGHGLSVGAGIAYFSKIRKKKYNTYVLISDGECNEGAIWEAAMFAGHHKLYNLTVIIDKNNLQSIKSTAETLNLEPLILKWKAFGWKVINIDGHNHRQLEISLKIKSKLPKCIIANTIKGKGVSFMENSVLWHYKSPDPNEVKKAILEIDNS